MIVDSFGGFLDTVQSIGSTAGTLFSGGAQLVSAIRGPQPSTQPMGGGGYVPQQPSYIPSYGPPQQVVVQAPASSTSKYLLIAGGALVAIAVFAMVMRKK